MIPVWNCYFTFSVLYIVRSRSMFIRSIQIHSFDNTMSFWGKYYVREGIPDESFFPTRKSRGRKIHLEVRGIPYPPTLGIQEKSSLNTITQRVIKHIKISTELNRNWARTKDNKIQNRGIQNRDFQEIPPDIRSNFRSGLTGYTEMDMDFLNVCYTRAPKGQLDYTRGARVAPKWLLVCGEYTKYLSHV